MQTRGAGRHLAPPTPQCVSLPPKCPVGCPNPASPPPSFLSREQTLWPVPHPSANLKGNKYKLYKVKGGPTLPWARPGVACWGQTLGWGLTSPLTAAASWRRPWA